MSLGGDYKEIILFRPASFPEREEVNFVYNPESVDRAPSSYAGSSHDSRIPFKMCVTENEGAGVAVGKQYKELNFAA